MDAAEYDLIVIGAGPVGENVADRAVQGGLSVAIVESELVGGECSYWACMPSKTLLRAGAVSEQVLDLPPQPRGIVRIGPATTVRSDPVGLLRREHAFDHAHELYVHPRTVPVPSSSAGLIRDLDGSPTTRLVDADMSFHAIREYAPGDSRRQVHWKSTAKTGRLMVRQYEESRRSRMAVVLGLAAAEYGSDGEFELAVSAASSLAVRAVHDARDLDIVVGAEIPRVVRGRLRAIRHIPTGSPRSLLDGFSGVDRLANTMAFADVCRQWGF